MTHQIARQMLRPLWRPIREQVDLVTWSFFLWERRPERQPTQARIVLAARSDEAVAERMAVLRGESVAQYRAWLRDGHLVLYAVGTDNDIQSWMWFTVAEGGPQIAPFDFGTGMKVPGGIGFLWNAFTAPAYRRQGLYKTLLLRSIEECFARGARQVWGHCKVTNSSRNVILTTDHSGETTIKAVRVGPLCRISRPGFHRTLAVGGVLEMDALLPSIGPSIASSIGTKAKQVAS